MKNRTYAASSPSAVLALTATALSACSVAGRSRRRHEVITIGYQSKTINTVTAGTLLRSAATSSSGSRSSAGDRDVVRSSGRTTTPAPRSPRRCWPGKIDIGSMGDYPLLINGSRAGTGDDGTDGRRHRLQPARRAQRRRRRASDSDVQTLERPRGRQTSPPASAPPATARWSRRSTRPGIDPNDDVKVENQDPAVGASALQGGSVDARGPVRGLAGAAGLPRRRPAGLRRRPARPADPARHRRPQRVRRPTTRTSSKAFLQAQHRRDRRTSTRTRSRPPRSSPRRPGCRPRSSTSTTAATGSRPSTPTLKQEQVDALEQDVPFLEVDRRARGPARPRRVRRRQPASREVYGDGVRRRRRPSLANPAAITGTDEVCETQVTRPGDSPARSGCRARTTPARSPTRPACCATSRQVEAEGGAAAGGVRPRRHDRHPLVRRPDDLAAGRRRSCCRSRPGRRPTSTPTTTPAPRSSPGRRRWRRRDDRRSQERPDASAARGPAGPAAARRRAGLAGA